LGGRVYGEGSRAWGAGGGIAKMGGNILFPFLEINFFIRGDKIDKIRKKSKYICHPSKRRGWGAGRENKHYHIGSYYCSAKKKKKKKI
jgi:hypothetical protein